MNFYTNLNGSTFLPTHLELKLTTKHILTHSKEREGRLTVVAWGREHNFRGNGILSLYAFRSISSSRLYRWLKYKFITYLGARPLIKEACVAACNKESPESCMDSMVLDGCFKLSTSSHAARDLWFDSYPGNSARWMVIL